MIPQGPGAPLTIAEPSEFDLSNEDHEGRVIKRNVRDRGLLAGILGLALLAFLFLLAGVPQGNQLVAGLEVILVLGGLCGLVIAISVRAPTLGVRALRLSRDALTLHLDHDQAVTLSWSDPGFRIIVKDFVPPHVWQGRRPPGPRFWIKSGTGARFLSPLSDSAAQSLVLEARSRGLTIWGRPQMSLDRGGSNTYDTLLLQGPPPKGWAVPPIRGSLGSVC
jgi:hypothetical protein